MLNMKVKNILPISLSVLFYTFGMILGYGLLNGFTYHTYANKLDTTIIYLYHFLIKVSYQQI